MTKALISLRICTVWSTILLLANPEDRFSLVETHMSYGFLYVLLLDMYFPFYSIVEPCTSTTSPTPTRVKTYIRTSRWVVQLE